MEPTTKTHLPLAKSSLR